MTQLLSPQQFDAGMFVQLLTVTVFTTLCLAVNTEQFQEIESSTSETTLQKNQGEYQLAYSDSCRQIMARNGLYVWQKPNTGSFVALLDYGQQVTIRNRGKNGWVPISAPVRGYIFNTDYLASCQAAATPPNQNFCRRVVANAGIVVRRSPSINAARVGAVSNNRNVLIAERGKNGWIPISLPLIGYVHSKYLGYCSG